MDDGCLIPTTSEADRFDTILKASTLRAPIDYERR
jgi:hypothetical protein